MLFSGTALKLRPVIVTAAFETADPGENPEMIGAAPLNVGLEKRAQQTVNRVIAYRNLDAAEVFIFPFDPGDSPLIQRYEGKFVNRYLFTNSANSPKEYVPARTKIVGFQTATRITSDRLAIPSHHLLLETVRPFLSTFSKS
jgi:hypothetical protein